MPFTADGAPLEDKKADLTTEPFINFLKGLTATEWPSFFGVRRFHSRRYFFQPIFFLVSTDVRSENREDGDDSDVDDDVEEEEEEDDNVEDVGEVEEDIGNDMTPM